MSLLLRVSVVAAYVCVRAAGLEGQAKPPPLEATLERAAAHLAEYQRQVPAVISEEAYDQVARDGFDRLIARRVTRADVMVIANDATDWVVFRDVFEVDGKPLRERSERLEALFLKPSADVFAQARRIAEESARFNVNFRGVAVSRTLNNPMAALRFLRASNLQRSTFRIEGTPSIDGVRTVEVGFDEQTMPRVLASPDNAAARGRFWIDPSSGRVIRSELRVPTAVVGFSILSTIRVKFAVEPKIGLSVPVAMEESYRMGNSAIMQSIEARASYSNFKKSSVDVSTVLKEQK